MDAAVGQLDRPDYEAVEGIIAEAGGHVSGDRLGDPSKLVILVVDLLAASEINLLELADVVKIVVNILLAVVPVGEASVEVIAAAFALPGGVLGEDDEGNLSLEHLAERRGLENPFSPALEFFLVGMVEFFLRLVG